MSKFCGGTGSIPSMTNDELRAPFPDGLLPSELPNLTDGMASEEWVTNYVQQLASQGRIPYHPKLQKFKARPLILPMLRTHLPNMSMMIIGSWIILKWSIAAMKHVIFHPWIHVLPRLPMHVSEARTKP